MTVLKHSILLLLVLFLQGCTYRIITDYSDCVSKELTFKFKDNLNLYIVDDSGGKHKYTSMNFPDGEHYICISENDECEKIKLGLYKEKWKIIPLRSEPFHLTGKYKTNVPNFILGAAVPDTSALQAEIAGKKVWMPVYELDERKLDASSKESTKALNKNTELINGWLPDFKCPNSDVKEDGWALVWFN